MIKKLSVNTKHQDFAYLDIVRIRVKNSPFSSRETFVSNPDTPPENGSLWLRWVVSGVLHQVRLTEDTWETAAKEFAVPMIPGAPFGIMIPSKLSHFMHREVDGFVETTLVIDGAEVQLPPRELPVVINYIGSGWKEVEVYIPCADCE